MHVVLLDAPQLRSPTMTASASADARVGYGLFFPRVYSDVHATHSFGSASTSSTTNTCPPPATPTAAKHSARRGGRVRRSRSRPRVFPCHLPRQHPSCPRGLCARGAARAWRRGARRSSRLRRRRRRDGSPLHSSRGISIRRESRRRSRSSGDVASAFERRIIRRRIRRRRGRTGTDRDDGEGAPPRKPRGLSPRRRSRSNRNRRGERFDASSRSSQVGSRSETKALFRSTVLVRIDEVRLVTLSGVVKHLRATCARICRAVTFDAAMSGDGGTAPRPTLAERRHAAFEGAKRVRSGAVSDRSARRAVFECRQSRRARGSLVKMRVRGGVARRRARRRTARGRRTKRLRQRIARAPRRSRETFRLDDTRRERR